MAHYWLGLSLMLAPISAWLAIRGEVVLASPLDLAPAVALGTAVLFWVGGFDIIYACQDYQFDKDQRLRSIPARLGISGALRIAVVSHVVMVVCLCLIPAAFWLAGQPTELGWIYWLAVVAVAVLLIYEHSLVRPDDLTRVNQAFFQVNSVISIGLLVIGAVDLWWL